MVYFKKILISLFLIMYILLLIKITMFAKNNTSIEHLVSD